MVSLRKTKRKTNHKLRYKKQKSKKRGLSQRNKKRLLGGSAFFAPTYNVTIPNSYNAYELNPYSDLPPSQATRTLPAITGGKKMKKRSINKSRKIKGGLAALSPDLVDGGVPNPLNSGMNSSGSSIITSAPYDMPINVPYGNHNPAKI